MISDDEEEEVLSEGEKHIRKTRDKETDEIKRVHKELEAQEMEAMATKFISLDLVNSVESQFDFPGSLRAFLLRCFEHIEIAPLSDYDVNHMLFSFYIKYGKPKLHTWSLQKLVAV
ncbi:unnamed protein product [Lactuca saligna]|uniref:Uncharacterized protein n=1 Tax=Lactuca saligna TaxID=75948 RepID=A0AA35XZR7_LACSI|nr:unnamed protein product [Lactuca saligna]